MQAHPVANLNVGDLRSGRFNHASDFVAQRQRVAYGRQPGPIVDVGVADAGGLDPYPHLPGADWGDGYILHL